MEEAGTATSALNSPMITSIGDGCRRTSGVSSASSWTRKSGRRRDAQAVWRSSRPPDTTLRLHKPDGHNQSQHAKTRETQAGCMQKLGSETIAKLRRPVVWLRDLRSNNRWPRCLMSVAGRTWNHA